MSDRSLGGASIPDSSPRDMDGSRRSQIQAQVQLPVHSDRSSDAARRRGQSVVPARTGIRRGQPKVHLGHSLPETHSICDVEEETGISKYIHKLGSALISNDISKLGRTQSTAFSSTRSRWML